MRKRKIKRKWYRGVEVGKMIKTGDLYYDGVFYSLTKYAGDRVSELFAFDYFRLIKPKPMPLDELELCAEDIAKRTDMRVRKPDWNAGCFSTIIDVNEYTIDMKHATFSYEELMTWVWLSDGAPCSKLGGE